LLLQAGIVERFDVYEIAEARVEQGRELAKRRGLADRLIFHNSDAFATTQPNSYDMVNWFDSLHHMTDVVKAIMWSRDTLVDGGVLLIDEFVGPTYMQYTDRQLDLAASVRACLPPRYLARPGNPEGLLPVRRRRPAIDALKAVDPTECADSGRILSALNLIFPNAEVVPTGGVVYHIALSDVLANLEENDLGLLNMMLLVDDLYIAQGESLRAFAFASKDAAS
jgi:SAM-dependent methyltransferase